MTLKSKPAGCPHCHTTITINFEGDCLPPSQWSFDCPECRFPVLMELELGQIKPIGNTSKKIIESIIDQLGLNL